MSGSSYQPVEQRDAVDGRQQLPRKPFRAHPALNHRHDLRHLASPAMLATPAGSVSAGGHRVALPRPGAPTCTRPRASWSDSASRLDVRRSAVCRRISCRLVGSSAIPHDMASAQPLSSSACTSRTPSTRSSQRRLHGVSVATIGSPVANAWSMETLTPSTSDAETYTVAVRSSSAKRPSERRPSKAVRSLRRRSRMRSAISAPWDPWSIRTRRAGAGCALMHGHRGYLVHRFHARVEMTVGACAEARSGCMEQT